MTRAQSFRRVFLIGFMGAGKTAVGRALARRLGWSFLDLDEVIESREGKSVAQIFADEGETGFRRMESAALRALLGTESQHQEKNGEPLVVALGGGTFAQPPNREALERAAVTTILLETPLEELKRRCIEHGQMRPLAKDETKFAQLFAERQASYQRARFRVQTIGKTVEEVAVEIEQIVTALPQPEVKQ